MYPVADIGSYLSFGEVNRFRLHLINLEAKANIQGPGRQFLKVERIAGIKDLCRSQISR